MALVTIPGGGLVLMPMPHLVSSTPDVAGSSSLQLNAASEQCSIIFEPPESGNLRTVSFLVQAVGSAPSSNHDVRIETVDAATGLSTGSLVGTNTNASQLLNATGFYSVTLTADAAVTINTPVALVIKAPASNFGDITLGIFSDEKCALPYANIAPTSATKNGITPILALEYDTGTVKHVMGCWSFSGISTQTFNSSTNPNRRGARFRVPAPMRLAGCDLWIDADADYQIVFYDSNGTSATVVYAGDDDIRPDINPNVHKVMFTTKPTIAANTYYRLIVLPTTLSGINTYRMDFSAAKFLDALPGGQDIHYTSVNGAPGAEGDWTQVLTSRPLMSLRFDQIDDGAGGAVARSYAFAG